MVDLIIEDGTIVEDANSFVTVNEIELYAANRGVTLDAGSPVDDNKIAIMAIKAMDYLNSLSWKGYLIERDQPLCWPRKNVYVGCDLIPENEIPRDVKNAQCQLCIYISTGIVLIGTSSQEAFVTREKVGPLETQYSEAVAVNAGVIPYMPLVDSMLADYLANGGGFSLRSVRV